MRGMPGPPKLPPPPRVRAEPARPAQPLAPAGGPAEEAQGRQQVGARPPVDPRFRRRWAEARKAEGRRRLRALLGAASLAALAGAWLGALHSPLFEVRHVRVVGAVHTARSQILAAAGLSRGGVLMVDVGSERAVKAVEALPWVRRVSFRREWPWSVLVVVEERSPAALVPGRALTDVVDATGRVLETLRPGRLAPALPVVMGVSQAPLGAYVRAKDGTAELEGLLRAAAAAPRALDALGLALSWSPSEGLVAHLAGTRATVLLGGTAQLAFKLAVLAELAGRVHLAGYSLVDLTVPDRPALTPLGA